MLAVLLHCFNDVFLVYQCVSYMLIVCSSRTMEIWTIDMFFFQAEDGIRDLVRSRGLGDVYKRQHTVLVLAHGLVQQGHQRTILTRINLLRHVGRITPVSYTHLTLPTSDLV